MVEGCSESGIGEGEGVTTGGKGRDEIRGEAREVTGVVVDTPTTDNLGIRYGAFGGWGMSVVKMRFRVYSSGKD